MCIRDRSVDVQQVANLEKKVPLEWITPDGMQVTEAFEEYARPPVSYTHLDVYKRQTGTCATVAALTELGICPAGEDVHVQLRGGELTIRVLPGKQLLMTGAAETVCEGTTEV